MDRKTLISILQSQDPEGEISLAKADRAARKAKDPAEAVALYRSMTEGRTDPDLGAWTCYCRIADRYRDTARERADLWEAPDILTGLACRDSREEYDALSRKMESLQAEAQQYLPGARRWAKLTNTALPVMQTGGGR